MAINSFPIETTTVDIASVQENVALAEQYRDEAEASSLTNHVYPSRQDFIDADIPDGVYTSSYLAEDGVTILRVSSSESSYPNITSNSGAKGWVPSVKDPSPEFWGDTGENTESDLQAISDWLSWGEIDEVAVVGQLGQSNLDGTTLQVGGTMDSSDKVLFWDGNLSAGANYQRVLEGFHPLDVTADSGATYSNNLGMAFARELAKREGRYVFCTQHARGSHPIENFLTDSTVSSNGWTKTTGGFTDFGSFMYTDQQAALAKLPVTREVFSDFLINLGEANADDSFDDIKAKILALIAELYSQGVADDTTVILWSELPDSVPNSDNRLKFLVALLSAQATYPNLKVVKTDGLPLVDSLHLTGDALDALALRYLDTRSSTTQSHPVIRIDETFTPTLSDGTNEATGSFSGHAHIELSQMYDDNLRPSGVSGTCSLYMDFTNIDTTGLNTSSDITMSWPNLVVGPSGGLEVEGRAGLVGFRFGDLSLQNVTFAGQASAIFGLTFVKINLSQSGVLRSNLKVDSLQSGVSDIRVTGTFPLKTY